MLLKQQEPSCRELRFAAFRQRALARGKGEAVGKCLRLRFQLKGEKHP
jgi:hypothetical protein